MSKVLNIGLDVGSTTVKSVVLDNKKNSGLRKSTIEISNKINSIKHYKEVLMNIYDIKRGE